MSYVIDASVAIKWYVPEERHERALAILRSDQEMHAPDWMLIEAANATTRKALLGQLSGEQLPLIQSALSRSPIKLHQAVRLIGRATQISLDIHHPVYDCLYLACAEQTQATVITDDTALCRAVEGSSYTNLAVHLPDMPF